MPTDDGTQASGGDNRFDLGPLIEHYTLNGKNISVVMFSWQGQYHWENNSQCQDFASIYPLPNDSGIDRLTLVVADGVGTRTHSRQGAELACRAIGDTFSDIAVADVPLLEHFATAQARFIALCNHESLSGQVETGVLPSVASPIMEYATTALTLCLDHQGFWAASVGDGAIYRISAGGQSACQLTEIRHEGFINEIHPLTSAQWQLGFSESATNFSAYADSEGFCLMTDGLSESIGDANIYFGTVWPELQQRLHNDTALREYAEAFCRYWEEHNFSSDDKTLVAVFLDT